jgi:hypothetical protein
METKLFAVIMTALCFASLYMLNLANKEIDTLKSDMANVHIISHPSYGKGYMVYYNHSDDVMFYQKDDLLPYDDTFAKDEKDYPAFTCPYGYADGSGFGFPNISYPDDTKIATFNPKALRHECSYN